MDRRDFLGSIVALSSAKTLLGFRGVTALDAPGVSLHVIDLYPNDVSDLAVTDGGDRLIEPDLALIGSGRQLGNVAPAWWCAMDGWIHSGPMNGKISNGPRNSAQDYVSYFQQIAEAKIPVTINMIMTANVTDEHPIFNDRCVVVMD